MPVRDAWLVWSVSAQQIDHLSAFDGDPSQRGILRSFGCVSTSKEGPTLDADSWIKSADSHLSDKALFH